MFMNKINMHLFFFMKQTEDRNEAVELHLLEGYLH